MVGDWDCMLNQTNIGQNNNKFYVIQMLQQGGWYRVWNRWGRVGEPGQNVMKGPFSSEEAAASEFCKKFRDKTKNAWEDRDNFTPVKGKYTLLEMDDEEGGEEVRVGASREGGRKDEWMVGGRQKERGKETMGCHLCQNSPSEHHPGLSIDDVY